MPTHTNAQERRPSGRAQHSAICLLSLCAALSAQGQANWTPIGSGCAGSAGVPELSAPGRPFLDETFHQRLHDAAPNSAVFLILGTSNPNLALPFLPGCTLLASLDSLRVTLADGTGRAHWNTEIPSNPSLAGQVFHAQCGVIDPSANPFGLAASNGGTMTLGARPPAIVTSFSPSTIGPGGVIEVVGQNFGDNPDDLCIGMPPGGQGTAFFRAESITRSGGVDRLRVRLVFATPDFVGGNLMMMLGQNRKPEVGARQVLLEPGEQWAWNGKSAPGHQANIGSVTVVPPEAIVDAVPWQQSSTEISVIIPIADPCDGVGDWRPRTTITTDLHGDMSCNGQTLHWDWFMDLVTVATPAPGTTIAAEHMSQIAEIFEDRYGVSFVDKIDFGTELVAVTPPAQPTQVRLWMRPKPGSGCSFLWASGLAILNCPDEEQSLTWNGNQADLVSFDASTGQGQLTPTNAVLTTPADIACSIDGRAAVATDLFGAFTFFDVDTGATLGPGLVPPSILWSGARIDVTRRGPTSRGLAVAVKGTNVRTLNMATYTIAQSLAVAGLTMRGVATSQQGKFAAVWGSAGVDQLRILQISVSGVLTVPPGSTWPAPSGVTIVKAAWNPNVSVVTALGSNGRLYDLQVSAAGAVTQLGNASPEVRWDPVTPGTLNAPLDLAFGPSGDRLYVAFGDVPGPFPPSLNSYLREIEYDQAGRFAAAPTGASQAVFGELSLPAGADIISVTDNRRWVMFATRLGVYGYEVAGSSGAGLLSATPLFVAGSSIAGIVSRKG